MARTTLWVILLSPLGYLVFLVAMGRLGANPVERLILESGTGALALLVFLLALPGAAKLTKWPWLKAWMRRRRALGLTIFAYASLHFGLWLLDHLGAGAELLSDLGKPFTASGLAGWVILFLLAITSNGWSIKKLGRRWKQLHRMVFALIPLLFIHLTLKDEGIWLQAGLWFGPLCLWVLMAPSLNRRLRARKGPTDA